MKTTFINYMLLGVILTSSNFSFAQKNRITLFTGTFHWFFDGTPLVNSFESSPYTSIKHPMGMFGGKLNDSGGIQYMRKINEKSSVSIEYSFYNTSYVGGAVPGKGLPTPPFLYARRLHKFNIHYQRFVPLGKKFAFTYGGGINYQTGTDIVLVHEVYSIFGGTPFFINRKRKDFGLNTRVGFEFTPVKQLTLMTYTDFIYSLFVKSEYDTDQSLPFPELRAKYGHKSNISRYNLSLNFGIAFNF